MTNGAPEKSEKANTAPTELDSTSFCKHHQHLLDEVEMMLAYATSSSIQLDPRLQRKIAKLFSSLCNGSAAAPDVSPGDPAGVAGAESELGVPTEPIPDTNADADVRGIEDVEENVDPFEQILQIHGRLTALVAPATPTSLNATAPLGWGWRINNPVVNGLIYVTIASLVLFVLLSAYTLNSIEATAATAKTTVVMETKATDTNAIDVENGEERDQVQPPPKPEDTDQFDVDLSESQSGDNDE